MKKISVIVIIILIYSISFCQNKNANMCYLNTINNPDYSHMPSRTLELDNEGNAIVGGNNVKTDLSTYGLIVRKIGLDGSTIWERTLDNWINSSYKMEVENLKIDQSNNIYLCGEIQQEWSQRYDGGFICKYSSDGTLLWNRVYDSENQCYTLWFIDFDNSGNVYGAGTVWNRHPPPSEYEIPVILKFNKDNGDVINYNFKPNLASEEQPTDFKVDGNGNSYVTYNGQGNLLSVFYKHNSNLNELFNFVYAPGGIVSFSSFDTYYDDVFITGYVDINNGNLNNQVLSKKEKTIVDPINYKSFIFRIQQSGNVGIIKFSNYINYSMPSALRIKRNAPLGICPKTGSNPPSGAYIYITGVYGDPNLSNWKAYVARFNECTEMAWNSFFEEPGRDISPASLALKIDYANRIYLTGNSTSCNKSICPSKVVTMCFDNNGNQVWSKIYGDNSTHVVSTCIAMQDLGSVFPGVPPYIFVSGYDYQLPIDIVTMKYYASPCPKDKINENIQKNVSNYPNPFNPSTNISYKIKKDGNVSIKIYDITGKEIKTLINEYKKAGQYIISFYANDLPSGIYFYNIKTKDFTETKKMILLK